MYDNFSAMYLHSENQRKASEAQYEADRKARAYQQANEDLAWENQRSNSLNNELEGDIARLRRQKNQLVVEVNRLRELLTKPFTEIAKEDPTFAANYHRSKELLASWMVSQRAYRECAIQIGLENGMSIEEVTKKATALHEDVIKENCPVEHGTNATEAFFSPYREKLINKFTVKST